MKPEGFLHKKLIGILLILLSFSVLPHSEGATPVRTDVFTNEITSLADSLSSKIPHEPISVRILFFGDSMAGALDHRMRQYACHNGLELLNVVWYSSTTKLWAQTDTLSYYLKAFNPDYILICLGANELFVRDLPNRKLYIRDILQKIGNRPYIWIAPPNWKKDTGINRLIEEQTGKCRYYPSWKLSFERKKDGAHPTSASSSCWMDSIAAWIMHESCYPIPLIYPDKNTPSTGKTILLSPIK